MVIHRIQTDETALSTARWDNPRFGPVDNFCEVSRHSAKRVVGRLKSGGSAKQMRNEWCFIAVPGRSTLNAWLLDAWTVTAIPDRWLLDADRPAPTVLGRPSCPDLDAIAFDYRHRLTDSQAKPDLFITKSHIERFPYAH